jgi:S-adenosylmethionine decarboxylase
MTANQTDYPPGTHVLLDFWGAQNLTDIQFIETALNEAARACGATVLETRLHQFGEGGGITGVALLAESHISIHTWPETGYAALDIFLCGQCDSQNAIEPLKKSFAPSSTKITSVDRGR